MDRDLLIQHAPLGVPRWTVSEDPTRVVVLAGETKYKIEYYLFHH